VIQRQDGVTAILPPFYMAIEYKDQSAGKAPESPEMDQPESESESETATIPASLIGGKTVSPGDVIRLEVVGVDEDSGEIQVKYASPKEKMRMGIDEMAGKFDDQEKE
jgi:hypothetical protein